MSRILITGGSGGIGGAIVNALTCEGHTVLIYDVPENSVLVPSGDWGAVDVLINCAGTNGIDWLENVPEADWDRIVGVNAKGIYLMSQYLLPTLTKSRGTILNIVSDSSHRPMNCSIAYNASKAAAHMMTLQMARELTKRLGITVFGVSPAHIVGTGMSDGIERDAKRVRGWEKEYTRDYQRANSVAGEIIDLAEFARFVAYLLGSKARHRALSGCVIPYGA